MRGGSRSWGRRRSSGRAATRRCGNSWRRRDRSRAVLRPQLPGSLGPRGPASLPGGDLNGDRHRHRRPARRRPDPPAGVARARARPRQRVPDDPEPGALRLPDPPAAHRGDRGHDGDRRAGGVRLAADRAEHLHGDRRRRSRGARGGPGYGMTDWQLLTLVELPLGFGVMLAGVRVATVVSVGTATIAAAIGAGGLGVYIFRGVAMVNDTLILAGAVPAALMALAADGLLGLAERRLAWRAR